MLCTYGGPRTLWSLFSASVLTWGSELNSGHQFCEANGKCFSPLSHLSRPLSSSLYSLLKEKYHFFSKLTDFKDKIPRIEKKSYMSFLRAFLDSYGTSGLLESRILNISFPFSKRLEGRVSGWGFSHPYVENFR